MEYKITRCNKCGHEPMNNTLDKFCGNCGEKLGTRDAVMIIEVEVEGFHSEKLTLEQFFEHARKRGYLK